VTAGSTYLLVGAFLAGMVIGGIFFGGLWLTIRHTLSSAALGLWLMGSFILRAAIALAGFYAVFAGDWRRLLACLLGFILARFILARVLQPKDALRGVPGVEVLRAP
jgi:F1F0 ATPase subunit 2